MEIRSLEVFIQVAELNSFTRAAEKLGYSQPTISFQIKQLERELGVQLFERIGHTISLTDEGRAALGYAQQICRMSQQMTGGADAHGEPEGIVRLAMADSLCGPLIVKEFARFRETYPKVALKVTSAGTDELFRLLGHNEADLVCTLDSPICSNAYVIPHEEEVGVHFVCSSSNPLAAQQTVQIGEMLAYPFLLTEKGMSYRRLLDESLARRSIEICPVLEIGSPDQICRLVEQGMGLSFLPDFVTEAAVREKRIVRLQTEDLQVHLWKQLICHRDKWMSGPLEAVIDFLSKLRLNGIAP